MVPSSQVSRQSARPVGEGWRSATLLAMTQGRRQAGVGENAEAAVFLEVDHEGLAGSTTQQEAHDTVIAGRGVLLAAGGAVDHQRVAGVDRWCLWECHGNPWFVHGDILLEGCDSHPEHVPNHA